VLGLGVLGKAGRDKVTIVASPGIADFGAWLEQLLAESTGKHRKGLIPVGALERADHPVVAHRRNLPWHCWLEFFLRE
jgi:glucose-6-phosphate isomerase